jgi:hypothetical protein
VPTFRSSYSIAAPLLRTSKSYGHWQTYDSRAVFLSEVPGSDSPLVAQGLQTDGTTPPKTWHTVKPLIYRRETTLPGAKWRHHKRFGGNWKPFLRTFRHANRNIRQRGDARALFDSLFQPANNRAQRRRGHLN